MEFFGFPETRATEDELQERLTLTSLPRLCDSIDKLLSDAGDQGEIYCLWGQFAVQRQLINGGVRFSMPGCPNALAWTITSRNGKPVIHCTINRQTHDPDFIESIELFVSDWERGLSEAL
jgi:hypothetical protein